MYFQDPPLFVVCVVCHFVCHLLCNRLKPCATKVRFFVVIQHIWQLREIMRNGIISSPKRKAPCSNHGGNAMIKPPDFLEEVGRF